MEKPRAERFFGGELVEYIDTRTYSPGGEVMQVSLDLDMIRKNMFDDGPGCWYNAGLKVDVVSNETVGENYVNWVRGNNSLLITGGFDSLFEQFVNHADSIYAMLGASEGKNPPKKDLIAAILNIENKVKGEFMESAGPELILRQDLQDKLTS
jgi:hypothetical protein